ncbi:MAG: EthD domain-containing protein [Pseudomonadota bacterium]
MIKLVYFFNRKPYLSVEDFQEYWRTGHAALVKNIEGIIRCVQCHTLPTGYRRKTLPPVDGFEEIWFNSPDEADLILTAPPGRAALDDLKNFVDESRLKHIITEEIVIKDGPTHPNMLKSFELVTRKPGMPLEEFHRYWREFHGPLAAKIKQIKRYVQSHTLMSEYQKALPPYYDGVAETWFEDTAAMRQSGQTPELAAVRADEEHFLAGELPVAITREVPIIGEI